MTIGELMNGCVVECTEDTDIEEAYELLRKCDHRLVVVIDSRAHRVPIGVVSDQSICEQVIGRGRNPRNLTAGSLMDTRIIRMNERDLVENISPTEIDGLTAIVVVDDNRQVRGILSKEVISGIGRNLATTHSTARIFVKTTPRVSPAISEIPAFGWIQ